MGVVCWGLVLVPSLGVGVGVRVCLARRLWAVALGSHRRTVLRKGWGGHGLAALLSYGLSCCTDEHLFSKAMAQEQSHVLPNQS